jgi:hypothetical protein
MASGAPRRIEHRSIATDGDYQIGGAEQGLIVVELHIDVAMIDPGVPVEEYLGAPMLQMGQQMGHTVAHARVRKFAEYGDPVEVLRHGSPRAVRALCSMRSFSLLAGKRCNKRLQSVPAPPGPHAWRNRGLDA